MQVGNVGVGNASICTHDAGVRKTGVHPKDALCSRHFWPGKGQLGKGERNTVCMYVCSDTWGPSGGQMLPSPSNKRVTVPALLSNGLRRS